MPSHILPQSQQSSFGIEETGAVESAGAIEDALGFAEAMRQRVENLCVNGKSILHAGRTDCLQRQQ